MMAKPLIEKPLDASAVLLLPPPPLPCCIIICHLGLRKDKDLLDTVGEVDAHLGVPLLRVLPKGVFGMAPTLSGAAPL